MSGAGRSTKGIVGKGNENGKHYITTCVGRNAGPVKGIVVIKGRPDLH